MKENVVILGAGIQGICCALALSRFNVHITLVDKTEEPLLRSGLRNEGKIHLGFVYANDASFRTASLMLRSAIQFAPLVESFIGRKIDWMPLRSRRFNYLILNETQLEPDKILNHYAQLQEAYRQAMDASIHYIGEQPLDLWRDEQRYIPEINPYKIKRCVPTEEVSLDLVAFRKLLLSEVAKRDNIEFVGNHLVEEINKTSYGYAITGKNGTIAKWKLDAGRVVNCLWENRLFFDEQLGIQPTRKWVYRLKHRILGVAPAHLAAIDSFTFVLGAFGDVVNYDNHLTYLSWYPACMSGWSSEIQTPENWEDACNGKMHLENNQVWVHKALEELDAYFPGLRNFDVKQIDGGIIFSWGKTDIVDMQSELHQRFDIGVHQQDGYFSIDTGKFTSAPLFAQHLKQQMQ